MKFSSLSTRVGNPYFQFKKFRISQDRCAMKVTTEACLFGAIIDPGNSKSILDVGGGTGLLSLMLAQRSGASITSIESDSDAFEQCKENFRTSPWSERLAAKYGQIQELESGHFDLIISNPPFYSNHQEAKDRTVNEARHQVGMTRSDVVDAMEKFLSPDGRAWILYPPQEYSLFSALAKGRGFDVQKEIEILNRPGDQPFRIVSQWARDQCKIEKDQIIIRDSKGAYTNQLVHLLKDYYLHL